MSSSRHTTLFRSRTDRMLGGVAGGLAERFEIDSVLVRILFAVATIANGFGILIYVVLWIIMPEEDGLPDQKTNRKKDKMDSPDTSSDPNNAPTSSVEGQARQGNVRTIFGMCVVLLGVVLLLNEVFPFRLFELRFLWPAALIAIGFMIITRNFHGK